MLAQAPLESVGRAAPLVLALPTPDGGTARFRVLKSPVMEAELAARFPQIKTYVGQGIDDPTATLRADLTPQGFHAQVLSRVPGYTFYLDPVRAGQPAAGLLSYWRQDLTRPASGTVPVCGAPETEMAANRARLAPMLAAANSGGAANRSTAVWGTSLRTYRLAVAATGEYTAFQGGTVALGLAAIVTTVNRVVGLYEKELAVRLVLVANNNTLIYTNAATDLYVNTSNDLAANQTNIDALIGTANYDIGHLVGTGGGGVAGLRVVCSSSSKAQGLTGSSRPVGDAFDIDYVAHEMGHQFGGNHPFNASSGSCSGNRNATTAWEPGSGSTIMAYAGICSPQNLQSHSDAYFHGGNLEEMRAYISVDGAACGTATATGNSAPTFTTTATGKNIPAGTPFRLTAAATDAENNPLTYCWEEFDLGTAGAPVTGSTVQTDNSTVPLFRSFLPVSSGTRYFSRLSNLRNNTTGVGEALPTVARTMAFRCTVRDNQAGGGGVNQTGTVTLTVVNTGAAFAVTAPNTAVSYPGGSTQTVTWNVAGTTAAPISCATVNLRLSTDGGLTFSTVLATAEPNDGSTSVTIPNTPATTCRVLVEAADNYFFDLSDANFTITAGTVTPTITGFTPTTGSAGTSVTITGTNLTGTSVVRFNGIAATTFANVDATTVTATVPAGASTGFIGLTATAGTTASVTIFTVPGAPTVASFTPTNGVAGTSVTVTGTNFTGATGATFNGTAAAVTVINSTTLTTTVPAGATTGPISVIAPLGIGTSASNFTVPPANDQCTGTLPLLTCGGSVAGTTVGSTSTNDPTVTCSAVTIEPVSGGIWYRFVSTGGSTTLSTNGAAFDSKLFVYSGTCAALTCVAANDDISGANSASKVTFTGTAGTTYLVFVSGFNGDQGAFTLTATCTVPTLSSLNPTSGPVGTSVTLTGTNFTGATAVRFNGTVAVTFSVTNATTATATVPAGATTGNVTITTPGGTSNGVPFTVTGASTTITSIVRAGSNPTNAANVNYTVTFAAAVTGVTTSNFSLTTTGVSGASVGSVSGAGTTYTVAVNTGTGDGTLTLNLANATGINPGISTVLPFAGETYTLDKTAPTATITSGTGASGSTSGSATFAYSVTFSESVTGFGAGDVSVGNGILSGFAGSGSTYIFNVTPTANGAVTVSVAAKVAQDAAGNGNTASATYSIIYAQPVTAAPVVTAPANGSLANDNTPTYMGTAPAGSTVKVFVDGTVIGTTTATGGTWSLTQPTALSDATHTVNATATVGGNTSAVSNTNGFTVDTMRPMTTITSTASSPTAIVPIPVTVTFLESVAGFVAGDVSVGNGTLSGFNGSGSTYTFSVTPIAAGAVTVNVAANVAQDVATNGNTVALQFAITYAPAPPLAETWTGAVSTDWNTDGNWNLNQVPGPGTSATIPPTTNRPLVSTTTVVCNNLTVQAGGRLSLAAAANLTISGSVTLASGSTLTQDATSELYITRDWTNNGATLALNPSSEVGFGGISHTLTGSAATAFQIMTVGERGGFEDVQLSAPVSIAVKLLLTNSSNVRLAPGGSLTLLSTPTRTALVAQCATCAVVGTVTVQRAITGPYTGSGYRHYSSPVATATVNSLATAGFTPTVNNTYNSSSAPLSVTPFPTVFGYDESRLASAANNLTGFDKGWFSPAAATTPLAVGRGYTVQIPGNETVAFVGTLNNGDRTVSLTRGTLAGQGLHLLGNPYPAPLDYSAVMPADRPGLDAALYVFAPSGPYAGSYRSYVNGLGASPVVALGQGFFTRVTPGQASGSLIFRNAQRVADENTATTFGRGTADTRPVLTLALAGNGLRDELTVYAQTGATAGLDREYDAVKLPNPSGLNLAALAATGEALAIDGRPLLASAPVLVPLSVGVPAAGSYTLHMNQLLNLPAGTTAVLVDTERNTRTDLATLPAAGYAFRVTGAQAAALLIGRFYLNLGATALATTPGRTAPAVQLFPNPAHAGTATLTGAQPGTLVTVFDALGRLVLTAPADATGTAALALPAGLPTGVYVVRAGAQALRLTIE